MQVLDTGDINNIIESRYKPCDLYIPPKHSQMKSEILEYKYLSINRYKNEIIPKATNLHDTDYAKSITAKDSHNPPHYGISFGSIITLPHIIAVILYTDCTHLCTDFSSTFRKIYPFDTLKTIKHRNRNYWWMSKLLRETVEIFGQCSDRDEDDPLVGPFYSGLSFVINISNFLFRLSSPTSTSIHLEVAMKFGGDDGIILKLDNPEKNYHCQFLRGFDCSIISNYPEEDERYTFTFFSCCLIARTLFCLILRLFFGGWYYIKLESIYMTKTNQNFNTIISALSYLDAIITGADLEDGFEEITDKHFSLLNELIHWKLGGKIHTNYKSDVEQLYDKFEKEYQSFMTKQIGTDSLFPSTQMLQVPISPDSTEDTQTRKIPSDPYIISIFEAFIETRTDIVIDYAWLDDDGVNDKIVKLIMYPFLMTEDVKTERDENDKINIFKPELFLLFKNIKSITLITNFRADIDRGHRSLSIKLLLSMINEVLSLEKIVILSYGSNHIYTVSWQSHLWQKSSFELIQKFKKSNFKIQLKYGIGPQQKYHGFCINKQ